MIRNILLAIFITVFVFGCHKKQQENPDVPAPSCYLTNYNCYVYNENYRITYDKNNRIDSVIRTDGFNSTLGYTYKYEYDNYNRLVKIIGDYFQIDGFYITYFYDMNGFLERDTIYRNTPANSVYKADSVHTFSYTGNNITRMDKIKVGGSHVFSTYEYNSAGDITKMCNFDSLGNPRDTTSFYYDNNKSNKSFLFFRDPIFANKKHNITASYTWMNNTIFQDSSYTTTFTYNDKGYPLTESIHYFNALTKDLTYTYNCK